MTFYSNRPMPEKCEKSCSVLYFGIEYKCDGLKSNQVSCKCNLNCVGASSCRPTKSYNVQVYMRYASAWNDVLSTVQKCPRSESAGQRSREQFDIMLSNVSVLWSTVCTRNTIPLGLLQYYHRPIKHLTMLFTSIWSLMFFFPRAHWLQHTTTR